METKPTPPSIFSILRRRYPESEYALMEEVRDKAGFYASNAGDYILMNLWPSRGLSLTGFELKSSRSDWQRELKQPAKAENIFQYCDYFYLLTTDETIAKLDEIPVTWGWMNIKKSRIEIKKEAPKLKPVEISRHFLAALLKRACSKKNYVLKDEIADELKSQFEAGKNLRDYDRQQFEKKYNELKKEVDAFCLNSGIDLSEVDTWNNGSEKFGKAVKFIADGGSARIKKELFELEKTAREVLTSIETGLKLLNEINIPEKIEA